MSDLLTPTVWVTFLGSTQRYDVYRVVFAAGFASDGAAQQQYQLHIDARLIQAKAAGRRVWLALDPSRLRKTDALRLLYRFAVPNLTKPITVRAYNVQHDIDLEPDREFATMLLLIRSAMRFKPWSATFQAALPPGFVASTKEASPGDQTDRGSEPMTRSEPALFSPD
jgi:hypothetical protein